MLLTTFAEANDLILLNTFFKKQDQKLATFRPWSTKSEDPLARPYYDQNDYCICAAQWRNCVKDVEADPTANVHTDHFPLMMKVRIHLKRIHKSTVKRVKWEPCSIDEAREYNAQIRQILQNKQNVTNTASTPFALPGHGGWPGAFDVCPLDTAGVPGD